MKTIQLIAVLLTLLAGSVSTLAFAATTADENAKTATSSEPNIQQLKGKIGPYAIVMSLDLNKMEEDQMVGTYYYVDRPHSVFTLRIASMEAINASGSMRIVLKEYSPSGKHTGTFDGQYECRGNYYAGTFTNATNGKKFKFVLE